MSRKKINEMLMDGMSPRVRKLRVYGDKHCKL